MNPFLTWLDLATRLRNFSVEELGEHKSPYSGELVGALAGLMRNVARMAQMVERLEQADPETAAAFRRAVIRSGENS